MIPHLLLHVFPNPFPLPGAHTLHSPSGWGAAHVNIKSLLTGIRLGCADLRAFSGVLSCKMTPAEKRGMCLNNEGSARGGPYGVDSMGPSMGTTPPAPLPKVISRLNKDSGAGSRGRSAPGTGTPVRLSNSLVLPSTGSKYLIIFFCRNTVHSSTVR